MKRSLITVIVSAATVVWVGTVSGITSWQNVKVVPKSQWVQVLQSPDNPSPVAVASEIEWPATVEKTDGQWLQIGDAGGYRSGAVEGWVRKDDIVRLENIQSYCTPKIGKAEAGGSNSSTGSYGTGDSPSASLAELYWIRGIYWENQRDTESAIADYEQAIAHGLKTGDIYLRLARLQADCAVKFEDQDFTGNVSVCECANKNFAEANKRFSRSANSVPRYYVSLGDAKRNRFRASGDFSLAKEALSDYYTAEQKNPSWPLPAYKQGKLLMTMLEQSAVRDHTRTDTPTLLLAIQHFSQAIRLDPTYIDAYQDRAEALLDLTTAVEKTPVKIATVLGDLETETVGTRTGRPFQLHLPVNPPPGSVLAILDQAHRSADRAYELSNNRGARALEIKARVEFAIAQELQQNDELESALADEMHSHQDSGLGRRARLEQAFSLSQRATELASAAANLSEDAGDRTGRFIRALICENQTNSLADDLFERGTSKTDKFNSQIASAKSYLAGEKTRLENLQASNPEKAEEIRSLVVQAEDAEKHLDEAQLELKSTSKQATPEQQKLLHSKLKAAGKALVDLGSKSSSGGTAAVTRPFKLSESRGNDLLKTVDEPIPDEAPPARSSHIMLTPLYLDAH